jgi:hypothetical protein
MLASYIFEVIFIALCFLSFLPFFKNPTTNLRWWDTHTQSLQKTMDTFLDAATFFSLWVGIAPYSSLSNFDYSSRFTVSPSHTSSICSNTSHCSPWVDYTFRSPFPTASFAGVSSVAD